MDTIAKIIEALKDGEYWSWLDVREHAESDEQADIVWDALRSTAGVEDYRRGGVTRIYWAAR